MPTSRDSPTRITRPNPWRLAPGDRCLVGMIHLGPLPTSPRSSASVADLARAAARDADTLAHAGFDAVLIENMHDAPYVMGAQHPAIVAAMTACALAVQSTLERHRTRSRPLPMGVQVLAAGNREALAVAHAAGGAFIRAENFVFAHVADEGLMPLAEAGPLLRARRALAAEHVAIWADLKKKHAAHALTADLDLADTAAAAAFSGADALILTGAATGRPTDPDDLARARVGLAHEPTPLPIVVGSGVTTDTVASLFTLADALIVGSALKRDGHWRHPIDPRRAAAIVRAR